MAAQATAKKKAASSLASDHPHLIGLEPVLEIVKVSLFTPFIESANPVAIMLIAPSGGGKTAVLKRYTGDHIHQTNDLTTSGLWQVMRNDKEEKITHICLEDFNPVLSHKSSVSNLTIASLLSVMADGMMRVDDGRETKELKHKPIGVVTGVTPEMFQQNLDKWHSLGLVRRFLPICFGYTQETISKAQEHIKKGKVKAKPLPPITLTPLQVQSSPLIESKFADQIEMQSVFLGANLGVNAVVTKGNNNEWERKFVSGKAVLPMAPHIILRTMAQARALMNRRPKVDDSDISFIKMLVSFSNPMEPVKL